MTEASSVSVALQLAEARLHLLEGRSDPASAAKRAELEEKCRELRREVGEVLQLPYRADTDY